MIRYRGTVDVTRRIEVDFEIDERDAPGQAAQDQALSIIHFGNEQIDDAALSFSTSIYRVIPEPDYFEGEDFHAPQRQ